MNYHVCVQNCYEDFHYDNAYCGKFDTKESAERFLHSHVDTMYDSYEEYCETFGVVIKECIFYYDDGHLNATNKIVVYEEDDWEGHLEDV